MKLLIKLLALTSLIFFTQLVSAKKSKKPYVRHFPEYSVKNIVKAKSSNAKRMRAALEEGGVMVEYSFSKKGLSGDKHSLREVKAVVLQKVSDNFNKEPLAHFQPSDKVGKRICMLEGHSDYFRSRLKFKTSKKMSPLLLMSDRFDQRILMKDIPKFKSKKSNIDPNDAAELLLAMSYLKSIDVLCRD